MTMPSHIASIIQTSLELEERDRMQRLQKSFTMDASTGRGGVITKSSRRGVAILESHDGGFEVVPIGDAEATVREIPPGNPKPWEEAYEQLSGENWEKAKTYNRAARPPGDNPQVHQEGRRLTSDAVRGAPMTAAKLQALNEDYRRGSHTSHGQPTADAALMMRKAEEREHAIANNKRRVKDERAYMAEYSEAMKAHSKRLWG